MKYESQTFSRVSENLFKSGSGVYYVRIKKKGRVHKQALGSDYTTAKRKLKDFLGEVENKSPLSPNILSQHVADEWLLSLSPAPLMILIMSCLKKISSDTPEEQWLKAPNLCAWRLSIAPFRDAFLCSRIIISPFRQKSGSQSRPFGNHE